MMRGAAIDRARFRHLLRYHKRTKQKIDLSAVISDFLMFNGADHILACDPKLFYNTFHSKANNAN